MAKRRRRNPGKKAEWTLFSIKGLATVAGLWWAWNAYKKKTEAAEAEKVAAEAVAARATQEPRPGISLNVDTKDAEDRVKDAINRLTEGV